MRLSKAPPFKKKWLRRNCALLPIDKIDQYRTNYMACEFRDRVRQTLGSIVAHDRWIWQVDDRPADRSAHSVFSGLLQRFTRLFASLEGGRARINATRAKVLATALFIHSGDPGNSAWPAARECATAFRALCTDSSAARRQSFVAAHRRFTRVLLGMNHTSVVCRASAIGVDRYYHVLREKDLGVVYALLGAAIRLAVQSEQQQRIEQPAH